MGYTHYFYREREISKDNMNKIANDFKKLLPVITETLYIDICGYDGNGEPQISENEISFNGTEKDDLCHESLYFPRLLPDKPDGIKDGDLCFEFCKTAAKPYDIAVVCFLIIAKHHLKDKIKVSSDGEDDYWVSGKRTCQKVLGYGDEYIMLADGLVKKQALIGDIELTDRGFEIIRFTDRYNNQCSLQQSGITNTWIESSAIWLGVGDNRMHINKKEVGLLVDTLTNWLNTGSFKGEKNND